MKYLRTNRALIVILLAGITAGVLFMPFASAVGPAFNIFPISYTGQQNHDLPMIDAKNVTRGEGWSSSQADHDAGIQASPGDIIEFSVFYHNGTADTPENVAIVPIANSRISQV